MRAGGRHVLDRRRTGAAGRFAQARGRHGASVADRRDDQVARPAAGSDASRPDSHQQHQSDPGRGFAGARAVELQHSIEVAYDGMEIVL